MSRNCDVIENKERRTLLQVLSLSVFPNFRYWSKCFSKIYRAQYGNAVLVYFCGTLTWRWENSVHIWNVLLLSRRLINCTEQRSIYISTFSNALTFKKVINHEISIYFSINAIVALCHEPP